MMKNLLLVGLLAFSSVNSLTNEPKYIVNNANNPQKEIKHVGLLVESDNTIEESGFMKLPLKVFNEGSLTADQVSRIKKWDLFDIIGKDFFLGAKVADLGTTGLLRVNFYDYTTGTSKIISKKLKKDQLPRLSYTTYRFTSGETDDLTYTDEDLTIKIENIQVPSNSRAYSRRIQIISNTQNLNLDVTLKVVSDQEGVSTVTSLDKTRNHFYYDVTSGNVPTQGSLTVDGKAYSINTDETSAGHNYGRGVWVPQGYVVKARGQGVLEDGKRFSIAFSSGYGDESNEATGDGFIVDKFTFKLNAVHADFNEDDLMKPIKFNTLFNQKKDFKESRVVFTPSHVETQDLNGDDVYSKAKIIVGKFSGYVTDFKNKKYRFEDLSGSVDILTMQF